MCRLKRYYYRRIVLGMSALEATYDKPELRAARRLKWNRVYRERWGYPYRNLVHRIRQEKIRSGEWIESEHPL